jgi:hypothetical protein
MFEAREQRACEDFDRQLTSDVSFMHQVLEDNLHDIAWPRETIVSFEISSDGTSTDLDVDMPEIEDMPRKTAKLPDRAFKVTIKELSGRAIADLYSQHVHAIGFRIIGETFATLPTVNMVTMSAFTQRNDPATGNTVDAYIYSVRVSRADWSKNNFDKLASVDPVIALGRFEIRRKLARNGTLTAIEPFHASA